MDSTRLTSPRTVTGTADGLVSRGGLVWLAETAEVRADPTHERMLPGAQSVIVVALPYARVEAPSGPPPARIARYAQGRDYHNVVRRRLRKLEKWLRGLGHDSRWSVDARPVLERAWAVRAGVGFAYVNEVNLRIPTELGTNGAMFSGAKTSNSPSLASMSKPPVSVMRVRALGASALAVTPRRPISAACTNVSVAMPPLAVE